MDNSGTELEIIQKLTAKERMFAITYAQNSNISAAARAAGYAKSSAQKCGQVLLRKPHVKAYISLLTTQYALSDSQIIDQARRKRIEMLPKALETVGAVMGMVVTQPAAALSAAKDVQDRVEGKPNQSVDLSPGKGAAMIAYVWGGDGT